MGVVLFRVGLQECSILQCMSTPCCRLLHAHESRERCRDRNLAKLDEPPRRTESLTCSRIRESSGMSLSFICQSGRERAMSKDPSSQRTFSSPCVYPDMIRTRATSSEMARCIHTQRLFVIAVERFPPWEKNNTTLPSFRSACVTCMTYSLFIVLGILHCNCQYLSAFTSSKRRFVCICKSLLQSHRLTLPRSCIVPANPESRRNKVVHSCKLAMKDTVSIPMSHEDLGNQGT